MSLKAKLTLSVVVLLAFVVGGVGAMIVWSERQLLNAELENQHIQSVQKLARVAGESLMESEIILLNYLDTLSDERGFLEAGFTNREGIIQMHSDPERIGGTFNLKDESIREYAKPVLLGEREVGIVQLRFDETILESHVQSLLQKTLQRVLMVCGAALVIGILGAFVMAGALVKPIKHLVGGLQEVAEGRLEPIPEQNRRDELGWAIKELNITIEKLRELDEMKKDFVSSVTHELRSPLTAILQVLNLAMEGHYGPLSPDFQESLLLIKNSATRLNQFVDNLLVAAKLEKKRMDIYLEEFDARAVIGEVATLYRPMAEKRSLKLEIRLPSQPLNVKADRQKTTQILYNLVSNALKFTSQGQVSLEAQANDQKIWISVQDTGRGIPDKDLPHLFDQFFRVSETTRQTKGTGLGLSIVKGFVELQGGEIQARNNPQGGATFSFSIPKAPLSKAA